MSKTSKTMSRKEILTANLSKEGKEKELKKIQRIVEDDADFFKNEIANVKADLKTAKREVEDFIESYTPMCESFLVLVTNQERLEDRLTMLTKLQEKYG